MKLVLGFSLLIASLLSCKTGNTVQSNSADLKCDVVIDKVVLDLVDSFSLELEKYKHYNKQTNDTVRLIGFIKIKESSDNKNFVIQLEGIRNDSVLKKVNTDHFFQRNGFYFCLDYNISSLVKTTQNPNHMYKTIIDYSNVRNFSIASRKEPSWLVKIQSGKIIRMKKDAFSIFDELPKGTISFAKDGSIVKHRMDEWGDIYDDEGNKIDSLK